MTNESTSASGGQTATPAPASSNARVANATDPGAPRKVHLAVRVFGVLMFARGALEVLAFVTLAGLSALAFTMGADELTIGNQTTLSLALMAELFMLALVAGVLSVMLGVALFKSRRRRVAVLARALVGVTIAQIVGNIMLAGVGTYLIQTFVELAILIALSVAIDPTLRREREMRRQVDRMMNVDSKREGMEGRDLTGKGYLDLNFFNLFWEFVACCVLGLILEIIWHMVVVDPGVYQDRAGLLFGPFSPIYGFGAVLVTLALNRLYNKSLVIIFLVSAVVGGAFEAFTALFMQLGFGAVAWDYSSYTILGAPDPIAVASGGRTSTMFVVMWGVLGLVWVKAFLPMLLRVVNLIPWRVRYGLTTLCALLMFANGLFTLAALDCWFERMSGVEPVSAAGIYFAEHYDNEWMAHRFESMTITPEESTRLASSTLS